MSQLAVTQSEFRQTQTNVSQKFFDSKIKGQRKDSNSANPYAKRSNLDPGIHDKSNNSTNQDYGF